MPTAMADLGLPALTRDLQIDYTALSLVAPEKIRFRYKLEGHDRDWQDVGTRRQAFYNDLRPAHLPLPRRWRATTAVCGTRPAPFWISRSRPPTTRRRGFWRCRSPTLIALVWGAHRVRLRIVEKHQEEITALNERLMKAQEQERIRIAGELHDGVMQDMLAVTMMLGTAKRRIPDRFRREGDDRKAQQKLIQAGTDISPAVS